MAQATPFKKMKATNSTAASFTAKPHTITEPSGDGIHSLIGHAPCKMVALFYGTGNDDTTFKAKIWGWRRISGSTGAVGDVLWVANTIMECTCTNSTSVGIASAPVINTERFADTIVVTFQGKTTDTTAVTNDNDKGATTGTVIVHSPADNTAGHVIVPLRGYEKIEFDFDRNSSASAANGLFSFQE